jgi:hypothetical protein
MDSKGSITITDQTYEPSQDAFLTNYNTTKVFDINFKDLLLGEPSLKKRNSTKMLVDSPDPKLVLGGNPRQLTKLDLAAVKAH